jgi:hypothetical protein
MQHLPNIVTDWSSFTAHQENLNFLDSGLNALIRNQGGWGKLRKQLALKRLKLYLNCSYNAWWQLSR